MKFTLAKMKGNELDFSFSGLKTAVLRWTQQHNVQEEIAARRKLQKPNIEQLLEVTPQATLHLLASFQFTVIEELLRRAVVSADQIGAESVMVAGGVACNSGLRRAAQQSYSLQFYFPSAQLSTDNAAMIASAAFFHLCQGETSRLDLDVQPGLSLPFQIQKK